MKKKQPEVVTEDTVLLARYEQEQEEKETAREWFNNRVESGDVNDTLENFKQKI